MKLKDKMKKFSREMDKAYAIMYAITFGEYPDSKKRKKLHY
ncbi:MAG TPA: hypothetical protein QF753_11140 [Victivallales bacterium]|nr:hypothetical protein [Victivallales bacterium]